MKRRLSQDLKISKIFESEQDMSISRLPPTGIKIFKFSIYCSPVTGKFLAYFYQISYFRFNNFFEGPKDARKRVMYIKVFYRFTTQLSNK